MMIPANLIIENHMAVSLLLEGRENDSLRLIKAALCSLRAFVESESKRELQFGSGEVSSIGDLQTAIVPLKSLSPSDIHGGVFRIFNRAFTIQSPEVLKGHVFLDQYKMGAILLYNAGLCYHLKGVHSGLSQDFAVARDFYRNAFSLVIETSAIARISNHDALLVLSLTNNMGHLNSSLFDLSAARVCLDMMQRLFSSIEERIMNDEDALFFFLTTMLVTFDHLCASPAA